MEEIERLVGELSINSFEVESMHWVEVTHIVDPFIFYIRPNKYRSIIQALESMEPTVKTECQNIQDLVIFNLGYSFGARKYIRGRISRIIKHDHFVECEIFAIDYGFREKIPIEYIWECPQSLANTPPLAYDCQLANCYPVGSETFEEDTSNAFRYYAGLEPLKMKVLGKKPHKLLVELINSIPESIATLLAVGGYSILGHYYDTIVWNPIAVQKRMFFNFKKVTVGEVINVRFISGDSKSEFHVAEVNDYNNHHLKEVEFITFYARREFALSPVHLIEGTLVCVKIEDKNIYERAFIKKVTKPKELAIVQLVDWGRDEEFPVGKMKYMSSQCLRTPVLAIYCRTKDIQPKDSQIEESQTASADSGLEDVLSVGNEFNITIKKLGHEFECPHTVSVTPKTDLEADLEADRKADLEADLEVAGALCNVYDKDEYEFKHI